MPRPPESAPAEPGPAKSGPAESDGRNLLRFTGGERAVHHATAALVIICLATAACLYIPRLTLLVGRRSVVVDVHVIAGLLLPVPFLAGLASRAFRSDLGRLNRFSPADWQWLRRSDRRDTRRGRGIIAVGKFNAGQKLNAAFVAGAVVVLLASGVIMLSGHDPLPRFGSDALRTGATFVHDWLSLAVFVAFLGHLYYALTDPGALGGMATGRVRADWAARHHIAWLDEMNNGPNASPGLEPGGKRALE